MIRRGEELLFTNIERRKIHLHITYMDKKGESPLPANME